jgi:hypothetical protein
MSFSGVNNVEIRPVRALWRIQPEWCIDFSGLTGLDVKGTAFAMYSAKDATQYYVWGDDSVVVDPADPGTGIPFTVVGDSDNAATLATACAAAIDANGDFSSTAAGSVVTIRGAAVGQTTELADIDMGIANLTIREGQDFDLGELQDNIELSLAPDNFIVQTLAGGVSPQAALFRGYEDISATTTLLETQNDAIKQIYRLYGGDLGVTSTFGSGLSQLGSNLLKRAARLVLRPTNAVDESQNIVMALAVPVPDSMVLSGQDPKTLSVTWQGFVDQRIDSNISAVFFGSDLQDLS